MAGRDRRTRRTALFGSLLIHIALLAPLLRVAPRLRTAQSASRASILLGLVPETGFGAATQRPSPGRPATSLAARAPAPPQQTARPHPKPSSTTSALPASASQTPPSATTTSQSADSSPPAAAGVAGNGDAVRRALHAALACAPGDAQNLDDEGRAACRTRLIAGAAAMGDARVDTIPPEKRAYYDAVAKAYRDPTATPHPPGIGCALPFGIPKDWKPSLKKPPHSLKLGPLPCYIMPPKGFLTEEADIPPADQMPKN